MAGYEKGFEWWWYTWAPAERRAQANVRAPGPGAHGTYPALLGPAGACGEDQMLCRRVVKGVTPSTSQQFARAGSPPRVAPCSRSVHA